MDMEMMAEWFACKGGTRGKIYTMDPATLTEEEREARRKQIAANMDRSVQARQAAETMGDDPLATNIVDLICNLQHAADAFDLDFEEILRRAAEHYETETSDKPREWDYC